MKNILNRIFIFSFVLVISFVSFIPVEAIEFNKSNSKVFEMYQIKEKEEVLVENTKIFEFYETNLEKLNMLMAERQREQELIEQQKRLAFKSEIVEFSKLFIGNPYVLGGTSLTNGADCSGFIQSVYRNFDIELPRTSYEQSSAGIEVTLEEIEIGDIVSYGYNGSVTHSALYIGDGKIIHASTPESGIKVDNMNIMPIVTIRRVI